MYKPHENKKKGCHEVIYNKKLYEFPTPDEAREFYDEKKKEMEREKELCYN